MATATMIDGNEWMTATQARDALGYSKAKMARVLKGEPDAGIAPLLASERHPLDKRLRLVRREDVERLKALPRAAPRQPREPGKRKPANTRSR